MARDQAQQKWQENGKRNAKTHLQYWEGRVYKPHSVLAGGVIKWKASAYVVRFQFASRREVVALDTANLREAAERARERYLFLIGNGWEAFKAKYTPAPGVSVVGSKSEPIQNVMIGDYLRAVTDQTELSRRLVQEYAKAFRLIVAEVCKIKSTNRRFDYCDGGNVKWKAKIDATPLAAITPERILAWKKARIARAGDDELLRRRAAISANSYIRRARALFSVRNVRKKVKGIALPPVLPFDGIAVERGSAKFFGCGVEAKTLLGAAIAELGIQHPEALKAFLLALVVGLRRREVDLLEWPSINLEAATVTVLPTRWYLLKTHESAATLPIEPEFVPLFRGWKAAATGPFVLESKRAPKAVSYQWYRCAETFDFLLSWLRAKGVQGNKPFHALRKLYGSALAGSHGIHAAAIGLRHTDIRTTSEHYADSRPRLTPGFGNVLSSFGTVVPFPDPQPKQLDQKTRVRS